MVVLWDGSRCIICNFRLPLRILPPMHPQLQGVDVGGKGKVARVYDGRRVPCIGVEALEVVYNAGTVTGALQYGMMLTPPTVRRHPVRF
jgi:hypothetical protein